MAVKSFCPSLSALLFPFYFAFPFEPSFPLPIGSPRLLSKQGAMFELLLRNAHFLPLVDSFDAAPATTSQQHMNYNCKSPGGAKIEKRRALYSSLFPSFQVRRTSTNAQKCASKGEMPNNQETGAGV